MCETKIQTENEWKKENEMKVVTENTSSRDIFFFP